MPQVDDHHDDGDDHGFVPVEITTIAGTGVAGFDGDGGPASAARLNSPIDVIEGPSSEIIITDFENHRVRAIDPDASVITTLAGTGMAAGDASLNHPAGVAVAADGVLYVAAWGEHRVYRYPPAGGREVIAGSGVSGCAPGSPSDPAALSTISFPRSLGLLGDDTLIFAEQGCHRIRQVTTRDTLGPFAGTGEAGYSGDDELAINATFNAAGTLVLPAFGMALSPEDPPDELYIADTENHVIREINLFTRRIETFAGTGVAGFADGPPQQATFNRPTHVFASGDHAVWVVDSGNHAIRRIDPLGTSVQTVAGTGSPGYNGDHIPAAQAQLNNPGCVIVTKGGDVLIADTGNHRVRRIASDSNRRGIDARAAN